MREKIWLAGVISVTAALQSGSRDIAEIFVEDGKWDRGIRDLVNLAEDAGVAVKRTGRAKIESHASSRSHGGVVARVGPRRYARLDEVIGVPDLPFVVMLDGIEDPFNFGQAVRALYAAGATGLVLRNRNWMMAAATVSRASAGTSERIPAALASTPEEAADAGRARGLTIACTSKGNGTSIYEANLTVPLLLLIGGEKRGITRSFERNADLRLTIPYGRGFAYSMGAAASAAVVAYEVLRQRGRLSSGAAQERPG